MSYGGMQTPISSPRLLEQGARADAVRVLQTAHRAAHLYWIGRYIRTSLPWHPRELDGVAVESS
jgi:hypothetical protein